MRRRLKWAVFGLASCVAAAGTVTLLVSRPDEPADAQIVVPQTQNSELSIPRRPPTTGSVPSQVPPASTSTSTPAPVTAGTARPAAPPPQPAPIRTTPKTSDVDFQAENARIRDGNIESDHAGFTGSGYVDYENTTGSSVEWTVTALTTTGVDVVFRFANGGSGARPMDISVNGILAASVAFPVTNGWQDWRTLTVHTNLLAGTNKIKATARTGDGGPNMDKITVS